MNVKTQSLIEVAAVILGLWVLISKMPDSLIFMSIHLLGAEGFEPVVIWTNIARLLIYLIIAVALIAGRKRLALFLDQSEGQVGGELPTLFSAAIALLGIYFFALGAVALGEALVIQFQENYSAMSLYGRAAISLIGGLLLFLCCGGLTKAWALIVKLRTAGV